MDSTSTVLVALVAFVIIFQVISIHGKGLGLAVK
jgi:hypothetical protein